MDTEIKVKKDTMVVKVSGRIDGTNFNEFEKRLEEHIENIKVIEFDFKKLEYISSSGLRVMLWAYKKINGVGGYIVLKHLSENVRSVFDLSGFSDFFIIK